MKSKKRKTGIKIEMPAEDLTNILTQYEKQTSSLPTIEEEESQEEFTKRVDELFLQCINGSKLTMMPNDDDAPAWKALWQQTDEKRRHATYDLEDARVALASMRKSMDIVLAQRDEAEQRLDQLTRIIRLWKEKD